MTDEPYRWLESVENRREYASDQLRAGSPVLAQSLAGGILLVAVGGTQPKLFEIFDRQMGAAFGHPADVERLRQAIIDMAHVEAFTRDSEDVTLRRLVGFGLSAQVKANFEQLFSAPILAEWLFAELGSSPSRDVLMRLHYHGGFEAVEHGVAVAAPSAARETEAVDWLRSLSGGNRDPKVAADRLLQAWWLLVNEKSFGPGMPDEAARQSGWRDQVREKVVQIGWLDRSASRRCKAGWLSLAELGL